MDFQFFAISPLSLGFEVKPDSQMIKLPLYPCKLYKITKLHLHYNKFLFLNKIILGILTVSVNKIYC
jgi:hypothetical protein